MSRISRFGRFGAKIVTREKMSSVPTAEAAGTDSPVATTSSDDCELRVRALIVRAVIVWAVSFGRGVSTVRSGAILDEDSGIDL